MALWLLCLGIVCVCVFLFALLAHTPPHSFLHARSSSNYFPRKFCMMTQRDQFNGNEFWIFLLLLTILLKLCFFPLSLYMRVVFTFIVSFLFNFQIRYRFTLISFQIREWIAEISVSGSLKHLEFAQPNRLDIVVCWNAVFIAFIAMLLFWYCQKWASGLMFCEWISSIERIGRGLGSKKSIAFQTRLPSECNSKYHIMNRLFINTILFSVSKTGTQQHTKKKWTHNWTLKNNKVASKCLLILLKQIQKRKHTLKASKQNYKV